MKAQSDPYPGTLMKMGGCLLSALVVSALILGGSPAMADDDDDDEKISEFLDELEIKNVRRHQKAWQRIADENDGIRTAGTNGYDESADYVERKLRRAGYEVERQPFEFQTFRQTGPSTLEQMAPGMVTYVENTDYNLMSQSDGTTDLGVTGDVIGVDLALANADFPNDPSTSTSGCEITDFDGVDVADRIVLVQRALAASD